MASVDISLGSRKKKKEKKTSHATAKMGGQTARDGRADKQKAPSVFISATLGCSVTAFLHAKQSASAAEARARIKRSSDGKRKWPESVTNACVHRNTRQTGVGTRLVWEGH